MFYQYLFIFCLFLFPILFWVWKDFRKVFYKPYPNAVTKLSEDEFYKQFEDVMPTEAEKKTERWKELLDKAWETRNFEIDLYWKRANYFWLFQVPAFTAYFLINRSVEDNAPLHKPNEIFIVICLGIVFSTAWFLINKGSKSWQRHWEQYIDLIECKYYGPFYQTVSTDRTFSVSKINEIVSVSFIVVWILFFFKFLADGNYLEDFNLKISSITPLIDFSIFFTILALISMLFGYGRGYFKNRSIAMVKRKHHYKN